MGSSASPILTRMGSKKAPLFVFAFIGVLSFFPLTGWAVYHYLERCVGSDLGGNFVPRGVLPGFYVRGAHFEWDHKVLVTSGDIRVEYDLLWLLSGRGVRVRLEGRGVSARLSGEWKEAAGREELTLEGLRADLVFRRGQLKEVFAFEVDSPAFQFQLKKTEKKDR